MTDPPSVNRRLAAILAADVVGYSGLMEADEAATLDRLKARRQAVLVPLLKRYSGRVVKLVGDGVLAEFGSAVNAVHCALELQRQMEDANSAELERPPILLRIGINVGDVIVEGGDLYGDGVNIAARLQAIAEPGSVYVSRKVQDELRGKTNVDYADLGDVALKNIAAPVRIYRIGTVGLQRAMDAGVAARPAAMPALAILPFKALGAESDEKYLADGITEDVLTELARFKGIRVVARHSGVRREPEIAGAPRLAADLGADYLAEGSVRKSADLLRVTIQLSESATGNRVWSEKYDVKPADTDKVVGSIVASLEQRMVALAAASARVKPASGWSAFDHLLQGRDLCNAYREPEAIPHFRKAVEIDASFAQAHAWLALAMTVTFAGNSDPELLRQASRHATAALSLDGNDATAHHANGMVLTWLADHERAGHHFDRALALNPADIQVRADRANWLRYCGRLPEALAEIDGAIGRSVACPAWFWAVRGEILFDMRRYSEALASFINVAGKTHRQMYLAAVHAYLGDRSRAAALAEEVLAIRPNLTEEEVRRGKPHAVEETLAHLIHGLMLAGVLR